MKRMNAGIIFGCLRWQKQKKMNLKTNCSGLSYNRKEIVFNFVFGRLKSNTLPCQAKVENDKRYFFCDRDKISFRLH